MFLFISPFSIFFLSSSLRCSLLKRCAWGRLLPLPEPLSSSGHACTASPQCLASEHAPALVEEAGRRVLQSGATFSDRLQHGVWVFVSGQQLTLLYNCVTFYVTTLTGLFLCFIQYLSQSWHKSVSFSFATICEFIIYCFVCNSSIKFLNLIGQKVLNNFL